MIRNPFRKPYVFSKKWAIWLAVGVPFILYADLTAATAKKSDVVSTTLLVFVIFVLLPWILMRITRTLKGKSPQGKTYDTEGEVIEGEVLNLKFGYRPRVPVHARLVNGVVEFPTGKIAIEEIKSFKVKDPRPLSRTWPIRIVGLSLLSSMIFYFYRLAYNFYHSLAILQPFLIYFSIILLSFILLPFIAKQNLVIKTHDGNILSMPFSKSLNPLSAYFEGTRIQRFRKKVKKAQKRLPPKR